jgi:aquaporin rerated protein, other eukaryote
MMVQHVNNCQMFLTAQLVFTIFMLAAEKHKATFIAPVGIGLSLFIAELMGVYYTGGSLNPARSFGPCVVLHSFYSYHWIYWVGPILGALLASGFYMFIKALEYETVNPEADGTGNDGMHFNPQTGAEKKVDNDMAHNAPLPGAVRTDRSLSAERTVYDSSPALEAGAKHPV